MAFHHDTIRKYTAALLNFFNGIEVQHRVTTGEYVTKAVPIKYSSREKVKEFDEQTTAQLLDGNYNVLPRAILSLKSLGKLEQRVQNKNNKINQFHGVDSVEFSYNSVPYEFAFDINIQCRGMNEASQIIEQIAPKFNPLVNIDIWDASNLEEATRIPVKLLDISIDESEYDELSTTIIDIVFSLSMTGNLYQPIKSAPKVKEFTIYLNQIQSDTEATKEEMMTFDVT